MDVHGRDCCGSPLGQTKVATLNMMDHPAKVTVSFNIFVARFHEVRVYLVSGRIDRDLRKNIYVGRRSHEELESEMG